MRYRGFSFSFFGGEGGGNLLSILLKKVSTLWSMHSFFKHRLDLVMSWFMTVTGYNIEVLQTDKVVAIAEAGKSI